MNQKLRDLLSSIQQSAHLSEEEKNALAKTVKDIDKEIEITSFKLDRSEKVKRTTGILLEETIEELEQKRKAVEAQNRELEIESALDKVRSVALSMKKPEDMLDICRVISGQLEHLGTKEIRNVQTAIFYESKSVYINYEYYTKHDKTLITEVNYKTHKVQSDFVQQMLKGPNEFFTHGFTGAQVKEWYAYQQTTNVFIDSYLEKSDSLNYYWYSLGSIALGISTYVPLKEEEINLFRRFRNVFELAYRRFLDIEKAMEQAREVQVELALERVRARTMAMQKSGELSETVYLMLQQLKELGENPEQMTIAIFNEPGRTIDLWLTMHGQQMNRKIVAPIDEPIVMNKLYKGWKEHKETTIIDISGDELIAYNKFRNSLDDIRVNNERTEERRVIVAAYFSKGNLTISAEKLIRTETIQLLKRFAGLFDLTYTRFLDLQKAEAQSREAQIELALERVRARTMAMQRSDELTAAASLLFKQLEDLGIKSWSSGFNIWQADGRAATINMCNPDGSIAMPYHLPHTEDIFFIRICEAMKRGDDLLVMETGGKELEETYNYMFSLPEVKKVLGAMEDTGFQIPKFQVNHCAFFSRGYLMFITYEPVPELWDVFKRFAKVFEQTYTRFLDLQKSEGQARESQIQLAMERVRARTMAMQRSEELNDTAALLFQQIKELGIQQWGNAFQLWEDDMKAVTSWTCTQGAGYRCKIPATEDPVMINIVNAVRNGESLYVEEMGGEALENHYKFLTSLPVLKEVFKNLSEAGFSAPKFQIFHAAYFSYGYILFITHEPYPEAHDIFIRFGKVFEQTYTRFLDLQNVEEQARESQIQLALERIRARTMAMQKSDELKEIIKVVYEQFVHLNILIEHTGFIMDYKTRDDMHIWLADKHKVPSQVTIPYFDTAHWNSFNDAKAKGIDFFANYLNFEEKNGFYQQLFKLIPGLPDEAKEYYFSCPCLVISTVLLDNVGLYIENFSALPYTDEENNTLMRFGKVFQQTYTRFLDLQKSEAQAIEAQIQLAMERVRARTMAMQHSDELKDAAALLFQQAKALGVPAYSCGYNIWEKDEKVFTSWMSSQDGSVLNAVMNIPLTEDANFICYFESKQNGEPFFVLELRGQRMQEHYEYLRAIPAFKAYFEYAISVGFDLPETQIHHLANFSHGNLLFITLEPCPGFHEVFKRFAAVFEQTYTRFLDLQKAEAQAREANIEAALERVRSRTMAMQRSDELQDAALLLFQQVEALGVHSFACGFNIWDEDREAATAWMARENALQPPFKTSSKEDVFLHIHAAAQSGETLYVTEQGGKLLEDHYRYMASIPIFGEVMDKMSKEGLSVPSFQIIHCAFFSLGYLMFISFKPVPEAYDIFKRFAKVFEQTYTRFLDLQKAEAQAREAQIEASLERVRSKTMAMHNSQDVGETVATLFDELVRLGITTNRCGILIHSDSANTEVWTAKANSNREATLIIGELNTMIHPMLHSVRNAWKNKEPIFVYKLEGKDLIKYYKSINDSKYYPTQFNLDTLPSIEFVSDFYFTEGSIFAFTAAPLPAESAQVFRRFAGVFGQTYRRYLDLQKAEAQAREAQIEAVMEKVRARSLAMQKPSELKEVAEVMRKEMGALGVEELETSSIYIIDEKNDQAECWFAIKDIRETNKSLASDHMTIHLQDTWVGREMLKFNNSNENQTSIQMQGENRKEWIDYCAKYSTVLQKGYYGKTIPDRTYHLLKFSNGYMGAASPGTISKESWDLLRRTAAVFSFAYTRFQDLQNAGARAREAQIELALERVRARTMAMFKSVELSDTAAVVFQQLINLGIEPNRLYIGIVNSDTGDMEMWATDEDGTRVEQKFTFNYRENESVNKMYQGWLKKKKSIIVDMKGKELENYFHYLNNVMHIPFKEGLSQKRRVQSIAFFGKGFIGMASPDEQSQQTIQLLERFAAVFDLTYTRFNDLKLAEAQASEATTEAALEKVRGKAMAMHNSNDLSVTASMVFTELRRLCINPIRCGVGLLSKETRRAQLYSATSSPNGDSLALVGWVQLENHPVMGRIYDSWLLQKDYFPELKGKQLKTYYERLLSGFAVTIPDTSYDQKQYGHFLPVSIGCLYAWSETPYNEDEIKILKRFASIIDLTFRRYIELQKSEANAIEAVRQAALDRVRADIASMRTTNDLERITPLIWNELTIIGIPFIRCGVFLMDDSQKLIHTFLSTPEGKAIAAFHLPYDTPGNFSEVVKHWHNKQFYIDHWGEPEFISMADTLVKQGSIESREQYLNTLPQGGFHLHFLPFLQGMLYVANTTELGNEELNLIQSVADAFSTAYARYEDFNKLEAAKQTVENTLTDLKQAQQQLVQSEKMASLGELTAGIAHEIQNPLNFVNNFSEVSTELIEELKVERHKVEGERNTDLEDELLNDIAGNMEKINHHGKRAGDIVRGMLQHSRSSSGQKEPTDINKLADEYLRLAYHGLRAKDKTFNATIQTNYEERIGNIAVIPQDIGRVILNLITNAFYAVTEKKNHKLKAHEPSDNKPSSHEPNTNEPTNQPSKNYEPIVSVSTKKIGDTVLVSVRDNGNGIPQKVLDKIFQPFFTTKPTGQGTGLGLSLSYDIVKVHGGEMKVETKEGEFAEFVITLPV